MSSWYWAAAGVVIFGLYFWSERSMRLDEERDDAFSRLWILTNMLDLNRDPDGRYSRAPVSFSEDFWHRPYRVTYSNGSEREFLEVRSAGPNGVFDDEDDLKIQRINEIEPLYEREADVELYVVLDLSDDGRVESLVGPFVDFESAAGWASQRPDDSFAIRLLTRPMSSATSGAADE